MSAQWARLGEVVCERNPQRIAINTSDTWPVADGLSNSLHGKLMDAIGTEFGERVISSESLLVRWMETRLASEVEVWQRAVGIARETIARAFSS